MTIPQQECKEKPQQKCEQVPKTDCQMVSFRKNSLLPSRNLVPLPKVPREKCTTFERDPKPGQCRQETRMKCRQEQNEHCQDVVGQNCKQVKRQKCEPAPKREKCNQKCEPVYWCKVCQ